MMITAKSALKEHTAMTQSAAFVQSAQLVTSAQMAQKVRQQTHVLKAHTAQRV